MKDRKKRKQREEVRKVLHAMRLELAAQRLAQEQTSKSHPIYLPDMFAKSGAHRLGPTRV